MAHLHDAMAAADHDAEGSLKPKFSDLEVLVAR
jgi:hypothetical protein